VRLSARERFSLAHELGHILLDQRFEWHPAEGKEYYMCEEFCDIFAAHLLVPELVLNGLVISTCKQANETLTMIVSQCHVSREVAARRLVETYGGLGYFEGVQSTNADGATVIALDWGTSSIENLRLTRFMHLTADDQLGKLLLTSQKSADWLEPKQSFLPGIGIVGGSVLNRNYKVSIISLGPPAVLLKKRLSMVKE
jgi:Zn-dependent peptidase ImmA (M78 family)